MTATLDESQHLVHGAADLTYVNNSPDTLREMFFHQYLNAFRPGSKWSAVDAREGRERFQNLRDPDYGYERFTAVPTFDGVPVAADYPGAPDSTVAHFTLPRPLAPGDSIRVHLQWDARPSTVLRRQGRRGRSYDFAQWYPKVAVYDRGGWEPNPLVPAGELYGEYGTYDVTLVVPGDQVLGATGRAGVAAIRGGSACRSTGAWCTFPRDAYDDVPPAPAVDRAAGRQGGALLRAQRAPLRVVRLARTTATRAGSTCGSSRTRISRRGTRRRSTCSTGPATTRRGAGDAPCERTIQAFKWLESIWGPFAYPSFTNLHRLEAGGTEFPMMIMDGSASQGLILHEGGHNFTYGVLGNNEWRSGWMDEGLTSYQTDWAQGQTAPELAAQGPEPPPRLGEGYRAERARR